MSGSFKDSILGRRQKMIDETGAYRPYIDSGGRPQMGFSVLRNSGRMISFLYHSIDNLESFIAGDGREYLVWTHRGTAVVFRGTKLRILHRAIVAHTLIEIWEPDGRELPEGEPTIDEITITALNMPAEIRGVLGDLLPDDAPASKPYRA